MSSNSQPSASLEIEGDQKDASGKKYTAYKVCLNYGGHSWFILRTAQEFSSLHGKIKPQFPALELELPKKKFFGPSEAKINEKRRNALDAFVAALLSNSSALENVDVREFLRLDEKIKEAEEAAANPPMSPGGGANSHKDTDGGDEEMVELGPSERKNAKPGDFEFLKTVGKGSFGKVFIARHKQDRKVFAVKVLAKQQIKKRNEVRHVMSERNVLKQNINHPFLCNLAYSFQTRDKLYFVLDYLNGGELFFHLQKEKHFAEPRAKFYAAEIASALGYLHENGIIYRDLKPENLLLDADGHVVLTDFGLCKEGVTMRDTTATFCGTPEYLAPEVILKQPYDLTVDWWCLGSVLYEMLFGLPPFYSRDHKEMYDKIVNQKLRVSMMVSPAAREILYGMLEKDRKKRLGSQKDFAEIRDHPFFMSIAWDKLIKRQIKPPYNPNVKSDVDTRHVDPEFTSTQVPDSLGKSYVLSASVKDPDNDFGGFTYVPKQLEDIAE